MNETNGKTDLNDGDFLFRFRSAKALLDNDSENGGFLELEKQMIYFANPDNLNDPMEGISDAFWNGDYILWNNFFRNYALSLIWYSFLWLQSKSEDIEQIKVNAWITEEELPTEAFREHYREFCSDFCADIDTAELARMLDSHTVPLRRERLTSLLIIIHQKALFHLFRVLNKYGLSEFEFPQLDNITPSAKEIINIWEDITLRSLTGNMPLEDQLELIATLFNQTHYQLELGALSRLDDNNCGMKLTNLWVRFPEMYIDAFLRELHFTPWRVSCFSRRCVNASMWGTYGNEHRGAVLVFRTKERDGSRFFNVNGIVGTGNKGIDLEVRPVTYRKRPPALDSFLNIGMLPMAKLKRSWMESEAGTPSIRFKEITNDIQAWRSIHWEKAFERVTWKHPDWAHEDEQRLIASTAFTDDPAPTPLSYKFSQIEGVIFGMRMTSENKLRIVKIIEKKCRAENRADFRFFQAYYSPSKGKMDITELNLLKFE